MTVKWKFSNFSIHKVFFFLMIWVPMVMIQIGQGMDGEQSVFGAFGGFHSRVCVIRVWIGFSEGLDLTTGERH